MGPNRLLAKRRFCYGRARIVKDLHCFLLTPFEQSQMVLAHTVGIDW